MPKAWKIVSQPKPKDGESPIKEYFLVAIPDRYAAVTALRIRKNLHDTEFTVIGEATPELVELLDMTDHQILSIMVVS
jgi:hypothetical protein